MDKTKKIVIGIIVAALLVWSLGDMFVAIISSINSFKEALEASIFFSIFLVFGIEIVISITWGEKYYTKGITLYRRRVLVTNRHSNIPSTNRLEKEFKSIMSSSFVFKEIAPNTFGFREKIIEFRLIRYSPIMHGMLYFDHDNNQIVVKGLANFSIMWFSLVWVGGLLYITFQNGIYLGALPGILFFSLILGILYWIQYSRYEKVAKFASHVWTRQHIQ